NHRFISPSLKEEFNMKTSIKFAFSLMCAAGLALVGGCGSDKPVASSGGIGVGNGAASGSDFQAPSQALVLKIDRENWQALTATCITPAFYNHSGAVPLIIDDGAAKHDAAIPSATASAKDFGADASAATAAIAKKYWKKAETVFVVADYEQAL